MASLSSLYLKKEILKVLLDTLEKKGENGIEVTISINDESNGYGQNVSAYVSQTKEQREAKAQRFYVGNGKCFWTDGKITIGTKDEPAQPMTTEDGDGGLPF